jgi:hypothetical protein
MSRQNNVQAPYKVWPAAMTRRAVVTTAAAVPLSVPLSVAPAPAKDAVADLIKGAEEKTRRSCAARWIAGPR